MSNIKAIAFALAVCCSFLVINQSAAIRRNATCQPLAKLDVFIKGDTNEHIYQGAEQVLKAIRPQWPSTDITYKMLTGGVTNKLVKCNVKDGADNEAVLVRVYGNNTGILIDRSVELKNMIRLQKYDMASKLYATFANGFAMEFVVGSALNSTTVTAPKIYPLVAAKLAKMHKLDTRTEPILWQRFDAFFNLIPEQFKTDELQQRFLNLNLSKSQILDEITALKPRLTQLNSPVVLCHNDLNPGNILYTNAPDTTKVTFIDLEYGEYNYQAFDIGNHFAAFAGVVNVDYAHYPSKEFQYDWLRVYAEEYHEKDGAAVTDAMLDTLYVQANQFALACHLFWGIWSLIQAEYSTIDFDYIEYGSLRFNEYFNKKEKFLALGSN